MRIPHASCRCFDWRRLEGSITWPIARNCVIKVTVQPLSPSLNGRVEITDYLEATRPNSSRDPTSLSIEIEVSIAGKGEDEQSLLRKWKGHAASNTPFVFNNPRTTVQTFNTGDHGGDGAWGSYRKSSFVIIGFILISSCITLCGRTISVATSNTNILFKITPESK